MVIRSHGGWQIRYGCARIGNVELGSSPDGFRMVGTSTPSKRGLFDMHGNVEELTFEKYTKRDNNAKDKSDITDPFNAPDEKSDIVVKGGSWNVGANQTSAGNRDRRNQSPTPGRGFRAVLAPVLQ